MRKLLFGLIGIIALLVCSCSEDQVFEQQVGKIESPTKALSRVTASGLGVDNELLYLKDDSVRLAGQIAISASTPEVSLQWNIPDSCNVDTTRTHLALKNGKATLDIKWDKMLERGNFGPNGTAFDGGVLISDGASAIYVHLIWTDSPNSKLQNRILTRSAAEASIMPKTPNVRLVPAELKMSPYNGGAARLSIKGVDFTYFEFDRLGSFTNISQAGLPEYVEGDLTRMLEFRWKGGFDSAPASNFKVPYSVITEDGLSTTGWLRYNIAEDDTLAVSPVEFTVLPLGGGVTSKITTNDETWQVTSKNIPAWLQTSTMEGSKGTSTLTFTVSQNTTMQDRTFTVYIETTSKSKGIIVNQLGVIPSFSVSPQSFTGLASKGTTVTLNVTSNTVWSITSAVPDWITPNVHTGNGNGIVTFTIAPNPLYEDRTFAMTFRTGGDTDTPAQTVMFTQNALENNALAVTTSSTEIGYQGGVPNLTITSNTSWSVSSDATWARVVDATGNENGSSDIIIQEHTGTEPRTATITVKTTAGSPVITKTITITQQPKGGNANPGGDISIGDFQDQNVNINGESL